ncbi:hypothetical protein T492DRAFT_380919 [Pavlovales sp. CCMP2436]|nr:hypothetical protein T492DRAFT_380919 [Pavlovales sp. CCMP2436]
MGPPSDAGSKTRGRARRAPHIHKFVIETTKEIRASCVPTGDYTRARSLIDALLTRGMRPTLVTANCLIQCYVTAGLADEAKHVLDEMEDRWGLAADSYSHNLVLRALCNAGRDADADRVLARACSARLDDACSYSTVIGSLSSAQRVGALLAQMAARSVALDAVTIKSAMRVYARAGLPNECEALLGGLPLLGAAPSAHTYASLAKACATAGDPEAAEVALREAVRRGLRADAVLFAIVAEGYASQEPPRTADVTRLVEEALRTLGEGALSLSLLHALLKAHARERSPQPSAVAHVLDLARRCALKRTVLTVCLATELLCNAGLSKEAVAHMNEARAEGIPPNESVWNILINAHARCRCVRTRGFCTCDPCGCASPDAALRLLRQMQAQVRLIPLSGIPIRGKPVSGIPIRGMPVSGIPIRGMPVSGIPISLFLYSCQQYPYPRYPYQR